MIYIFDTKKNNILNIFFELEKTYISTGSSEKYKKICIGLIIEQWRKLNTIRTEKGASVPIIDCFKTEAILNNLYYCRSTKDKHLSNAEVKRKNLYKIKALHPDETDFLVFDDDPECIEMYKQEGCSTCLVSLKG